jgi:thiamine monophosphate kinase
VVALLTKIGTPISIIGEITAGPGLAVIAADGSDYRVTAHGYNHFALSPSAAAGK